MEKRVCWLAQVRAPSASSACLFTLPREHHTSAPSLLYSSHCALSTSVGKLDTVKTSPRVTWSASAHSFLCHGVGNKGSTVYAEGRRGGGLLSL